MIRDRFALDQANHLAIALNDVLARHLRIVQAGGGTPDEASTIALTALSGFAFKAIGVAVLSSLRDADADATTYREAIEQMSAALLEREH